MRARLLAMRRALSAAEAVERSGRVRAQLYEFGKFRQARRIFTYASSKDNEVDTLKIIADMLAQGREVACPLAGPGCALTWRHVSRLSDLHPGAHGVLEPPATGDALEADRDAVVLVPGIAFTASGARLGYGKGYFDRFLAHFPGTSIGLAYDLQVVPEIPCEPHDVGVDVLATESRINATA